MTISEDVNCPYCSKWQEINHDDGYGYDEGVLHEQECSDCEKYFTFTTSISFFYQSRRADCLNGKDHKYLPYKSIPNYWPDKKRCEDCGHVVQGKVDLELINKHTGR